MAFTSDLVGVSQSWATPTLQDAIRNFFVSTGWTVEYYGSRILDDFGRTMSTTSYRDLTVSKAGIGIINIMWSEVDASNRRFYAYVSRGPYDSRRNGSNQPHRSFSNWPPTANFGIASYVTGIKYWFFEDSDAISLVFKTLQGYYYLLYLGKYDSVLSGAQNNLCCMGQSYNSSSTWAEYWMKSPQCANRNGHSYQDGWFYHPDSRLSADIVSAGAQNLMDTTAHQSFGVIFSMETVRLSDYSPFRPTKINLRLRKVGNPTGSVRVTIYSQFGNQPADWPRAIVAQTDVVSAASLTTSSLSNPSALQTLPFIKWHNVAPGVPSSCWPGGNPAYAWRTGVNNGANRKFAIGEIFPGNVNIAGVRARIIGRSNPVGTVAMEICADNAGVPGTIIATSASLACNSLPVTNTDNSPPNHQIYWHPDFQFASPVALTGGVKYWFVLVPDATYLATPTGLEYEGYTDGSYAWTTSGYWWNGSSWVVATNNWPYWYPYEFSTTPNDSLLPFSGYTTITTKYWAVIEVVGGAVDAGNYVQVSDNIGSNGRVYDGATWNLVNRNITYDLYGDYWCAHGEYNDQLAYCGAWFARGYMGAPQMNYGNHEGYDANPDQFPMRGMFTMAYPMGYRSDVDSHLLVPLPVGLIKANGARQVWIAGLLHNLRSLRIDNLIMEQSLFNGADEWVVFPNPLWPGYQVLSGSAQAYIPMGYAVKKVP
jgi:hypothetical protein